jgi:hypothetical protein
MNALIEIKRVSNGVTCEENNPIRAKDATHPQEQVIRTVVDMSDAQYQGLRDYLAHIKAGTNTGAVETAITAL